MHKDDKAFLAVGGIALTFYLIFWAVVIWAIIKVVSAVTA